MTSIILSIKPQFVDKILKWEKKFELRKSIPNKNFDNVIIYKSENISNENSSNLNNNLNIEPIILQGHIDMVCEKSLKSSKNMELESIDLEIDGDFITAKETTLGADNGIAVAMMLAILDANDLIHPPIEAVFTSDEEIGLIGANALDMSKLKGKELINLDSEEEGVLVVSCAGGNRVDIEIPVDTLEYSKEDLSLDYGIIDISIEGLKGGHSGIEVDKGLANANKILGKLLKEFNENDVDFNLIDISGGNLDNAIPNSSFSTILIRDINKIKDIAKEFEIKVNEEFKGIEDKIEVNLDFKEFSKISISSICDEVNVDKSNLWAGKASAASTELVKNKILEKLKELER